MMDTHVLSKSEAGSGGVRDIAVSERTADTGSVVVAAGAMSESAAMISMIERVAMSPNADLDKMERLLSMRERMAAIQAKQIFLSDFADLQRVLPAVARKGTADKTKYARFEDIIDTIKEPLARYGFSLSFRLDHSDKAITVTGVLGHSGGHSEATSICLPPDAGPKRNAVQAWGSAVTYGKRYVAVTLLGIATQDDDDGNAAGKAAPAAASFTVDDVKAKIAEAKASEAWFCERYSVESLDDLTNAQRSEIMSGLNTRIRAMKKGGKS